MNYVFTQGPSSNIGFCVLFAKVTLQGERQLEAGALTNGRGLGTAFADSPGEVENSTKHDLRNDPHWADVMLVFPAKQSKLVKKKTLLFPCSTKKKRGNSAKEFFSAQCRLRLTGLKKSATIRPFATKKSRLASGKILLVDSLATESCCLADRLATKLFFKADNANADRT